LESDHAVKDASAFEKGEVLQISSKGKELTLLGFTLMGRGYAIETITLNSFGHAELTLSDRVGHARWMSSEDSWTVILADQQNLKELDLNQLFRTMKSKKIDQQKNASDQKSKGWIPKASNLWGRNPDINGTWRGSSLIKGIATQFTFLFEADGTLRIERSMQGKTETITGRWMTQKDNLRLIYSNQSKVTAYRQLGSTLQFEFDQANVTFYRK
jgi:hypothetical protein